MGEIMKQTKKEIADRLNVAEYMLDTFTDFKDMIVCEFDLGENISDCDNDYESEINIIMKELRDINSLTKYLADTNNQLGYENYTLKQDNKKLLEENKKLLEYKNKAKSMITELYNIDNHNWIDSSSEEEDSDCEEQEPPKKVVKRVIRKK
jgi:hypothetical protein